MDVILVSALASGVFSSGLYPSNPAVDKHVDGICSKQHERVHVALQKQWMSAHHGQWMREAVHEPRYQTWLPVSSAT